MRCLICSTQSSTTVLCETCTDTFHQYTSELPALFCTLRQELHPSSEQRPRVTGSRQAPLPVRLEVLNLVGPGSENDYGVPPIAGMLSRWEMHVRVALNHSAPVGRVSSDDLVFEACRYLQTQIEPAALYLPETPEMFAQIKHAWVEARRVIGIEERTRHIPIGPCPTLTEDGSECGQLLMVRDPQVRVIECDGCRVRRYPSEWLYLGRLLHADKDSEDDEERLAPEC